MQITSIQNVIRNNFQYKNNPIKFGAKYNLSQEGDVVELSQKLGLNSDDVVVSKKYHRGELEFDPNSFMQRGQRLFIEHKGRYLPYGCHLEEYNAKGERIRHTSYNNGFKYFVDSYKNGELVQEDRYEDTFGIGLHPSKRTSVRKFDGLNASGTKHNIPFAISRNYGKDWKNHPEIEMVTENLIVQFSVPSEEKTGHIRVADETLQTNCIYVEEDGRLNECVSDPNLLLFGLKELRKTIQSEEFSTDFGFSDKFNSELDKAIEFISSKINED